MLENLPKPAKISLGVFASFVLLFIIASASIAFFGIPFESQEVTSILLGNSSSNNSPTPDNFSPFGSGNTLDPVEESTESTDSGDDLKLCEDLPASPSDTRFLRDTVILDESGSVLFGLPRFILESISIPRDADPITRDVDGQTYIALSGLLNDSYQLEAANSEYTLTNYDEATWYLFPKKACPSVVNSLEFLEYPAKVGIIGVLQEDNLIQVQSGSVYYE